MKVIWRGLARMDWITVVPFPLSVILMEVFWVFPWLIWVSKMPGTNWTKPSLGFLSLIFILGASFIITKFFLNRKWQLRRVRLGMFGCALLTVFIIIRIEYSGGFGFLDTGWFVYFAHTILDSLSHTEPLAVALVAAIYLWWRGISLARSELDAKDIFRFFLVGTAALVMVIIISGTGLETDSPLSAASIWFQLTGFFFFGLMAIALANLKSIQHRMTADGTSPALNRRWSSVLALIIGGLVTTGAAIVSLVSAEFVNSLVGIIGSTYDFLFRIFATIIFVPLRYILIFLSYIVRFIIELAFSKLSQETEVEAELSDLPELPEPAVGGLPPELVLAFKMIVIALLVAGVVFLLVKALFRYMSLRERDGVDETHESLWSWAALKVDIRQLLDKLQQFLESKKKMQGSLSPLPDWYLDSFPGMLSVQQIYRCLLREASRIDVTRLQYETPNEYAGRLVKTVPEGRILLDELTGLYIETRYGEFQTSEKRIADANSYWKTLRRLLRQSMSEQTV